MDCRMLWLAIVCLLVGVEQTSGLRVLSQPNTVLTTVDGARDFEMSCPVADVAGQVIFTWKYSPAKHLTPGNTITESLKYSLRSDVLVINKVDKTDAGLYTASVTDTSRRIVRCTFEVTVESLTEANRGQYQCQAANPHGSVISPVTVVNIQWPLKFVRVPPSVIDQREGNNITLLCNVTGFPHARLLWYQENGRQNDEILTNTSHTIIEVTYSERVAWSRLTFDTLNVTDNGMYKCEATNVNQQIIHNFELVVHAPPRITSQHPAVRRAHVGMQLTMECTALGFPPPRFTWFRNGRAIPRIGNTHVQEGWDGLLTINSLLATDAGNYTCQAVNDVGYVYSGTTRLDIFGIYFVERAGRLVAVKEGNSTQLPCHVGGADRGVRIEWLKNGMPVETQCTPDQADSNPSCKVMLMNNTLYLLRVSTEDVGTYTCRATELGKENPEVIEAETTVLLAEPVVIYPRLKATYEGDEGKALSLECKARGSPPPVVEWIYRGLHLLNDSHRMISGGTIKFKRLLVRDSGHYLCLASNNITEARQEVRIRVNSVPALLNLELEPKGTNVRLEWNVIGDGGYPVTSIKYEYRMISPKTGKWSMGKLEPNMKTYKIKGLQPNSTYEIRMWATNKLGKGTILRQVFATSASGDTGNLFLGLSEENLKLIYIGAGVAGGLFLLILIIVVVIVCRRKPDPSSIRKRNDGIEDGQALVDAIQESPSHVNPAYGSADNATTDNLELCDVKPTDSSGTGDKNASNGTQKESNNTAKDGP
ncbi:protein turtle homolog B-like [Diadema antillarum]|uniref:protein turtle homolog B-like n=1 Tax=Diadema antillarum TaxID=105358 RepID=UPI003A8B2A23